MLRFFSLISVLCFLVACTQRIDSRQGNAEGFEGHIPEGKQFYRIVPGYTCLNSSGENVESYSERVVVTTQNKVFSVGDRCNETVREVTALNAVVFDSTGQAASFQGKNFDLISSPDTADPGLQKHPYTESFCRYSIDKTAPATLGLMMMEGLGFRVIMDGLTQAAKLSIAMLPSQYNNIQQETQVVEAPISQRNISETGVLYKVDAIVGGELTLEFALASNYPGMGFGTLKSQGGMFPADIYCYYDLR